MIYLYKDDDDDDVVGWWDNIEIPALISSYGFNWNERVPFRIASCKAPIMFCTRISDASQNRFSKIYITEFLSVDVPHIYSYLYVLYTYLY